jgi:hypothetical protein
MTRYERIKSLSIDEMAVVMAAQFLAGMIGYGLIDSKDEGEKYVKALLDTEDGHAAIEETKQHLLEEVDNDG